MIVERHAPDTRIGAFGAGVRPSLPRRWPGRFARSDRSLALPLADSVGGSVLVRLMLAMTFVALAALFYLAQATQVSVLQFSIADLQAQRTQLLADNANLRVQATALQSLQRIDTLASTQLHMTKRDISTDIWVRPVVPRVPTVRGADADTVLAVQASRPLAWMTRVLSLVESSL